MPMHPIALLHAEKEAELNEREEAVFDGPRGAQMKKILEIVASGLLLVCCTPTNGQEFGQTNFGLTRQQIRNCTGMKCPGVHTGHDCGPEGFEISPNPINATVGEIVEIRFDSSQICNGMSVSNLSGTAKFETGTAVRLSDAYGYYRYKYKQAGSHTFSIDMTITCSDPAGHSVCKSSGSVPVNVGR